jgi:glycine/D-amino acid oxidase-like deaminating enzyme
VALCYTPMLGMLSCAAGAQESAKWRRLMEQQRAELEALHHDRLARLKEREQAAQVSRTLGVDGRRAVWHGGMVQGDFLIMAGEAGPSTCWKSPRTTGCTAAPAA